MRSGDRNAHGGARNASTAPGSPRSVARVARILDEIRAETPAALSRHHVLLDHMRRQWGARIGLMEVG